jgi:uncharacterized protein (DUF1501 family)
MNRRRFLKNTAISGLAVGTAGLLGSMQSMQALAHTNHSDYKALVCLFLLGGNDSYNMLIPYSTAKYSEYANARGSMALERNALLPITEAGNSNPAFALHPSNAALQSLFNDGKLAVIANCGALIEPVTKTAYHQGSATLPPRLFSHNDQQAFIATLQSSHGLKTGWAGRINDHLGSAALSRSYTLSGANPWQTGDNGSAYAINAGGIQSLSSIDSTSSNAMIAARSEVFHGFLQGQQNHILAKAFADKQSNSIIAGDTVSQALENQSPLTTVFPSSTLGADLKMVARLIQARSQLNQQRQIFFVGMGGWDTHADQLASHEKLLLTLSEAMAAFYQASEELGIADAVTTFTASDFGRTLSSNGDGTDHGWAGNQIIMGGSVDGKKIYGQFPDLTPDGPDDAERGRLIPTTAQDQIGATLASWFHDFSSAELDTIFPNLKNFSSRDLGFMR